MIASMAYCALADILVDSQTEAQLLQDLEIEQGPHNMITTNMTGEPMTKKARTATEQTPTAVKHSND